MSFRFPPLPSSNDLGSEDVHLTTQTRRQILLYPQWVRPIWYSENLSRSSKRWPTLSPSTTNNDWGWWRDSLGNIRSFQNKRFWYSRVDGSAQLPRVSVSLETCGRPIYRAKVTRMKAPIRASWLTTEKLLSPFPNLEKLYDPGSVWCFAIEESPRPEKGV